MWKKRIISLVITTLITLSTVSIFVPEKVGGIISTTRYVGGTGPGNYSTIHEAIGFATSGDTIVVYPGLYQENLLINKSLTIMGKNRVSTIIKPLQINHVVTITSDYVALDNLTIRGENHTNYAGIKVDSRNHTRIQNCNIMYNSYGIWLYSSRQNDITSCTFSSNYDGIWVHYFSQYNTIQWCHIFSNTHSGVYLCCASAHNTISQNTFTSNAAGVDASFSWNEIYLNNFFNNTNNALCPAHENTWDNGTVGNYWSDFDEPGEGAYDENGNGIVDSPYVIPGEKEIEKSAQLIANNGGSTVIPELCRICNLMKANQISPCKNSKTT